MPKKRSITFLDTSLSITAWARKVGIKPATLWKRIDAGWPLEKALAVITDVNNVIPEEEWRPVPGFADRYEVSSLGRVRAIYASFRNSHRFGRFLKPWRSNRTGHLRVSLWTADRKETKKYVHVLVLTAFVGPCPPGLESLHDDNNAGNNKLSNLKWGTPKENAADQLRHGTRARGVKNGHAKLTENQVLQIRQLAASGHNHRLIAERFRVSRSRISYILHRKNWSHL
jgi:hypothetical protein